MSTPDYRYDRDSDTILVATHRRMPSGRPPRVYDPAERLEGPDAVQHYRTVSRPGFKGVMRLGDWRALRPAEPPAAAPTPEPLTKPSTKRPGRPIADWPRVDSDPGDRRIGPHGVSEASHRCPPSRTEKGPDWAKRADVMQCYTWWTSYGDPMPGAVPLIEWLEFAKAPDDMLDCPLAGPC